MLAKRQLSHFGADDFNFKVFNAPAHTLTRVSSRYLTPNARRVDFFVARIQMTPVACLWDLNEDQLRFVVYDPLLLCTRSQSLPTSTVRAINTFELVNLFACVIRTRVRSSPREALPLYNVQ